MTVPPYPPTHPGFWPRYWVTLRPYLFFVSGSVGWVGLALGEGVEGVALGLAMLAFFLTYGLGQALTETTQIDTDSLSAPYRPLVRGEITASAVVAVSLTGLSACAAVFAWLNPWTLAVSLLCVIGLATYTPLKRRWWGGPPWNSWIVGLLPLIGWLAHGGRPWEALGEPALAGAMVSAFGTYATFVLLGYLKDVEADRASGYDTFAVHFGRRPAVAMSAAFGLLGLVGSLVLVGPRLGDVVVGTALWGLGFLTLGAVHLRFLPLERDEQAGPLLVYNVLGLVWIHLGEAALVRPGWGLFLVAVAVFAVPALLLRPERGQV